MGGERKEDPEQEGRMVFVLREGSSGSGPTWASRGTGV